VHPRALARTTRAEARSLGAIERRRRIGRRGDAREGGACGSGVVARRGKPVRENRTALRRVRRRLVRIGGLRAARSGGSERSDGSAACAGAAFRVMVAPARAAKATEARRARSQCARRLPSAARSASRRSRTRARPARGPCVVGEGVRARRSGLATPAKASELRRAGPRSLRSGPRILGTTFPVG
jgi:hypothetical protein